MRVKVIIVGGSISGLSLANMLEKLDIDYILLEGHSTIAPQLGASLGLLPSGLRILDQLECYERIKEIAGDTYYKASMRLFGGGSWVDSKPVTFSQKLEERVGYPQIFVDRKSVIQVLFKNLKFPERVLTDKRVNRVENQEDKVTVITKDGSTYTGDFVVGADGVHSTVRQEMWRAADEDNSGLFASDPIQDLQCESKCIFGISRRPAALPKSSFQINAFFNNCNYMILSAPEDRLYWFLFTPSDKVFGKDIPKFSKEDERALAEEHFLDRITDDMLFKDIYENRLQTTLVSVEDHVFSRWHYRRIITIGDAAHKLHPISAQGGNGAMETSAVLTNSLVTMLNARGSETPLSEEDINSIFADVQAKRFQRAVDAVNQGRQTSSASIKETVVSRIFVNHFFPRFGQSLIFKLVIKNTLTGPVIQDLPIPSRHTDALNRHKRAPSRIWPVLLSTIAIAVGLFPVLLYNHSLFLPISQYNLL